MDGRKESPKGQVHWCSILKHHKSVVPSKHARYSETSNFTLPECALNSGAYMQRISA
jgi:hypothetical protein